MDRNWINFVRISDEYEREVEDLYNLRNEIIMVMMKQRSGICALTVKIIKEHLLCDGFLRSYTTWTWHGELLNLPRVSVTEEYVRSTIDDVVHDDVDDD